MQWHKAAVSWFGTAAQKNKAAAYPKHCNSALVFGDCTHVCRVDFIGVNVIGVEAVAQGCCQLVWHSSTEKQGRQFTLNSAAVQGCMLTAHLHAEWIFIDVNVTGVDAVAQGCFPSTQTLHCAECLRPSVAAL